MIMFACENECQGKTTCLQHCGDSRRCLKIVREHTDKNCWCEPVLDYKDPVTGTEVWVHNPQ